MMDGKTQASCWGEADSRHFIDPEPDPVDMPSRLFDQLVWLRDADLTAVDVYWMKAGHALFGGRKPDEAEVP
jgi:hypothetical protein